MLRIRDRILKTMRRHWCILIKERTRLDFHYPQRSRNCSGGLRMARIDIWRLVGSYLCVLDKRWWWHGRSGLKKYLDIMVNLVGGKAIHWDGKYERRSGTLGGGWCRGEYGYSFGHTETEFHAKLTMEMSCQRVLGWRESIWETTVYGQTPL